MIIQVDPEGRSVIKQLCDIALRYDGIGNLNQINVILRSVKMLPTPEDIEQGTNLPKSPEKEDEAEGQVVGENQKKSQK